MLCTRCRHPSCYLCRYPVCGFPLRSTSSSTGGEACPRALLTSSNGRKCSIPISKALQFVYLHHIAVIQAAIRTMRMMAEDAHTTGMWCQNVVLRMNTCVAAQGGGGARVAPPPLVREDVVAGVCERAVMAAHRLGLAGAARLQAFMHAETADLIVAEADTALDFRPSAPLLFQARLPSWACPSTSVAQPGPLLGRIASMGAQSRHIRPSA